MKFRRRILCGGQQTGEVKEERDLGIIISSLVISRYLINASRLLWIL